MSAFIFALGGFALAVYMFKPAAVTTAPINDSVIRSIYVDDGMRGAGLRAERVLLSHKTDKATIYVSFLQEFSGAVILQAYDRTGAEIGRSRRMISGTTDEATYVDFEFNQNVPLKLAESFKLVYAKALPVVEETESQTTEETVSPAEEDKVLPAEQAPAPEAAPSAESAAETAPEQKSV